MKANVKLCDIVTTYLNLDTHGKQLTKISEPSRSNAAQLPSFVVQSALPRHHAVREGAALAMLRSRQKPQDPSKLNLERAANSLRDESETQEVSCVLPYCQQHWLLHSKTVDYSDNERLRILWQRLLNVRLEVIAWPWVTDPASILSELFF